MREVSSPGYFPIMRFFQAKKPVQSQLRNLGGGQKTRNLEQKSGATFWGRGAKNGGVQTLEIHETFEAIHFPEIFFGNIFST